VVSPSLCGVFIYPWWLDCESRRTADAQLALRSSVQSS
jgi:hypothetical protein